MRVTGKTEALEEKHIPLPLILDEQFIQNVNWRVLKEEITST
jgi:hypothetical protein